MAITFKSPVILTIGALAEDMSIGELREKLLSIGIVLQEARIETVPCCEDVPSDDRWAVH